MHCIHALVEANLAGICTFHGSYIPGIYNNVFLSFNLLVVVHGSTPFNIQETTLLKSYVPLPVIVKLRG